MPEPMTVLLIVAMAVTILSMISGVYYVIEKGIDTQDVGIFIVLGLALYAVLYYLCKIWFHN